MLIGIVHFLITSDSGVGDPASSQKGMQRALRIVRHTATYQARTSGGWVRRARLAALRGASRYSEFPEAALEISSCSAKSEVLYKV